MKPPNKTRSTCHSERATKNFDNDKKHRSQARKSLAHTDWSPHKTHSPLQRPNGPLLAAIGRILHGEEDQITIRHLFYRLVGEGVISKTEAAYKNLCGHLSKYDLGDISGMHLQDSTRWHIQQRTLTAWKLTHSRNPARTYRRNLWSTQPFYLEVWVEKDAIAGIVAKTANSFGVPVFVCRGFASLSSLYSAASTFREATQA